VFKVCKFQVSPIHPL
jgi:hypothetical protein